MAPAASRPSATAAQPATAAQRDPYGPDVQAFVEPALSISLLASASEHDERNSSSPRGPSARSPR